MTRTRIKICGVGRVEDALAAADAGADAVGIVLHRPAARYVNPARAREIIAALPPFVTPVGLFVDASPDEILTTAQSLGLRHVQLHGHEPPPMLEALGGLVVLKAVRVARATFRAELAGWREGVRQYGLTHLRGLVLETAADAPGGTGLANDWDFIRQCQRDGSFDGLPPIIAAGGLNPQNVAAVVRDIHPWAVDVSSGVESARGIKSREKIEVFIQAVTG